MSNKQKDERRINDRTSWECHARLLPLSLESSSSTCGMHDVMGQDISEGGVRIWSDRLFSLRSHLLVEMDAPEIPGGIQAVGSVAWISPSTSKNQWYLGIEFSDIGDSALSSIRSLAREEPATNREHPS